MTDDMIDRIRTCFYDDQNVDIKLISSDCTGRTFKIEVDRLDNAILEKLQKFGNFTIISRNNVLVITLVIPWY